MLWPSVVTNDQVQVRHHSLVEHQSITHCRLVEPDQSLSLPSYSNPVGFSIPACSTEWYLRNKPRKRKQHRCRQNHLVTTFNVPIEKKAVPLGNSHRLSQSGAEEVWRALNGNGGVGGRLLDGGSGTAEARAHDFTN